MSKTPQRRRQARLELSLPMRARARESRELEWAELTRVTNVSQVGARFNLLRQTEIGRILHLTLPLPPQLRSYDHYEPQYLVWALVRSRGVLRDEATGNAVQQIGVAFIGQAPPADFDAEPGQLYEIVEPSAPDQLWAAIRKKPDVVDEQGLAQRRESRYSIALELELEIFNSAGETAAREATVTENISPHGALIYTSLEITRGRIVRVHDRRNRAILMAAVRANRIGADGVRRLHLEFIGKKIILDGID